MVTTERRALSFKEYDQIVERLNYLKTKEGSKIIKDMGDAEYCAMGIVKMSCQSQVIVFYDDDKFIGLLAFDVVNTWWTPKRILDEEFILSMTDDFKGFARIAIDKLIELAEYYKASLIAAGCFFQDKPQMVTNSYIKKGFNLSQPIYMKMMEV